ncbi:MAG: hypothetical protein WBR26_10300 [Candidatus Acidiferrum sp.]
MKFFMPGKSAKNAETLYQGFRQEVSGTGEGRIYSLAFLERIHGKWKVLKVKVGSLDPLEGRMVMAIVKTKSYYFILEQGRGDNHMMVEKTEVPHGGVEEFEP